MPTVPSDVAHLANASRLPTCRHHRGNIKCGNEAEVALGERLASTYAAQADTPPEGRPAKAATKRSAPDQIGKGNRRRISVTENPPAPAKKRGTSRTTKTPCKEKNSIGSRRRAGGEAGLFVWIEERFAWVRTV
jgi:hypothetical protein